MKKSLRRLSITIAGIFLLSCFVMPYGVGAQGQGFAVLTLANGQTISMTQAQLQQLLAQPGVSLSPASVVTATQMSVPLPASLGGQFIVAEPAALAQAMNTIGLTSGLEATSFAGATANAGTIMVGEAAGAAMSAGMGAGTIGVLGAVGAAVIGGGAAMAGGGGGGGGGDSAGTTTTHTTTSHH